MMMRYRSSRGWRFTNALCTSLVALSFGYTQAGYGASQTPDTADAFKTATPIKHMIILIGENRGFDHTFGVYKPKGKGQTISNLLSKGIVNQNGKPGPNFAAAEQFIAPPEPHYYIGVPKHAKTPYGPDNLMPQRQHQRGTHRAEHASAALQLDRDRLA